MHLDLQIDLGVEPVVGSVAAAGKRATPFSGYTGLIAALEALRLGDGEQEERQGKEQA